MSLTLSALPEATRLPHSSPNDSFLNSHPALRDELRSLRRETDPELRAEGLLSLARRLERRAGGESAAVLYRELAQSSGPAQGRAFAALEAIQGRGNLGARAEIWLRDFTHQVSDPATLLAMGIAGSVFRVVRLSALARFQSAGWSGSAARFGAGLAGLSLEAPTFALSAKAGAELLNRHQDWSLPTLGRDALAGYLTLAGLRIGGALGRGGLGSLSAPLQASPALRLAFGQGGLLGGVLLAHSLEAAAGLRQWQSAGGALFEGLSTLLHFQVAGRLSRAAFGENFAAWERRIDVQSEGLSFRGAERRGILHGLRNGSLTPFGMTALAGVGIAEPLRQAPRPLFSNLMHMSGKDDTGRSGPSQSGTRPAYSVESPAFPEAEIFLDGVGNSEAGLRNFLNRLPVPATVARIKGEDGLLRIFIANGEFLSHFGYNERELAQHPLTHYLSLKSAPIMAARLWTMVRGGVFKAAVVDFQGRRYQEKVWMSGVVRNVYDQDLAFAFYQPRPEGEFEQPPVPPMLKAFQVADGIRPLEIDSSGFYELRSSLELSLQLSNRHSPLLRQLRQSDLQLRITEIENSPLSSLALPLERNLSHWAQQLSLPPGRSLLIEQAAGPSKEGGTLHFVNAGFSFSRTEGRPPAISQTEITQRISTASPERTPLPARPRAGGIYERVQQALAGIGSSEDNGSGGSKPPKK